MYLDFSSGQRVLQLLIICAVSFTTVQLFYFTTRPNLQTDSTIFEGASVKFLRIWGSSRESRLAFKTICLVSCNLSGIFSKAYSRHKCYRNLKQTKTTQKKTEPRIHMSIFSTSKMNEDLNQKLKSLALQLCIINFCSCVDLGLE